MAQQSPCETDPVYRQFDFWIGDWEVYDLRNNKAGDSRITSILNGCILQEEWTSANLQNGIVYSGKSFNTYNAATKQWQQTWVDNTGKTNEYLIGKFDNTKIEFLTSPFPFSKDTMAMRRLTFYNLSDQKVRQHGEISKDKGLSWKTEYDLDYRRKKGGSVNKTDIKGQYTLMEELFKKNRMAQIADFYMDDAKIIGSGMEVKGREAIIEYWKQIEGKGVAWEHNVVSVEMMNDIAFETGISKLIYMAKKNTETAIDVRYTAIWRKNPSGDWKISHYHYTNL
ncbi:MAG: nuclear transport factor 2 family protein [Bacteroidota bacterium]